MSINLPISDFNKALLSLEGLLKGIAADDIINQKEIEKLKNWEKKYYERIKHHPVGELLRMMETSEDCHIILKEEKTFIEEFCKEYSQCDEESDPLLCDQVRMYGYIEGILADSKIYEKEISSFYHWLIERPHLAELKEYNEIVAQSESFLQKRQISNDEMLQFLKGISRPFNPETGTPPL